MAMRRQNVRRIECKFFLPKMKKNRVILYWCAFRAILSFCAKSPYFDKLLDKRGLIHTTNRENLSSFTFLFSFC